MTPKYRADIDGLRAVAVLSVLFFHSDSSLFSGGYVGVDIFFVISGYLITTIVVREIANDGFSISRFYERRFRRILPALTIVIAASITVGSLLLTPNNLVDLGQSTIATAIFSSNILFYLESGYFDGPSVLKPLLHTWSLAVEEQFYIFFPLLLVLIAKFDTRHYLKWLISLGVFSFIACVILSSIDSSGAFYLIPTRAWELFIGSILALHVLPAPKRRCFREVISFLGIILIAYSVSQYTSETNFPDIAATVPTIGSACIIYAGMGGQSFVSNILSLRPIVFLGLISYSLYLWHWPVIVYTKIYSITDPSAFATGIMFVLIFILSFFSWRYIETPFRKKALLRSLRSLLSASAIVSLAVFSIGLILVTYNRMQQRNENDIAFHFGSNDYEWVHWESCEGVVNRITDNEELCDIGKSNSQVSFIIWGDSHARALASGIDLSAKRQGVKGKIAIHTGCPPLLSIERPNSTSCDEFNQEVLKIISDTPDIKTVILLGRWALSTTGKRYKHESGSSVKLVDIQSNGTNNFSNYELFSIGLNRTIEELHSMGKKIILVNPIPEIGFDVPSANFVAEKTGRDINALIAPTLKEYEQRVKDVKFAFNKIRETLPVEVVTPETYLCDKNYCSVVANGIPLYRDDNHLSTFGSKYISQSFDTVFQNIAWDEL